jgi:hypothetical protein
MSIDKDSLSSKILSAVLNIITSNDKSKLAILKVLLEKGTLARDRLLSLIAETYYRGLPSAWIVKSLDSLVEMGLVSQDKNVECGLSSPAIVGKLFFEQEVEIQKILLRKWGAGDLYYLEPLWQYVARRMFLLGSRVQRDLLLEELRKDAEDRIGPFSAYASIATVKYTVIPRELEYMQEFGLIDRTEGTLRLPDFMVEFIFQQRTTLLQEIQGILDKLRHEKEEINQKLLTFQKIYDLQQLKKDALRQLSDLKVESKEQLVNHLLNAYNQFEHANCYDAISSCGRAAELLVAQIFLHVRGKESAKQIRQMGNQLSKLWKTEVPGQITTPLEFVLSLLSSVKWLRDKKGAHPSDLTGFRPPTIDDARQTLASILLATKYAMEFDMLAG